MIDLLATIVLFFGIVLVGCGVVIAALYAIAAVWTTFTWVLARGYAAARRRRAPTWWERFQALDGGNQ